MSYGSSIVFWRAIGGFSSASAVAMGAFGSHALKGRVDDKMMNAWSVAVQYHLFNSVALMALPLIRAPNAVWSGRLLVAGSTLFSSSLYAMVLTDTKKLGAVTPVGGVFMMLGYVALAVGL